MESPPQPAFTWITAPLSDCPACGNTLYAEEAELRVIGPKPAAYALELGHCEQCGRWYGLIDDLEFLLEEEDWTHAAVQEFQINQTPVPTGVWLDPDLDILPWPVFREQVDRFYEAASAPPPASEEVRALDRLDETWEIGVRPAAWVGETEDTLEPAYLAVVIDGDGLIRGNHLEAGGPPDPDALAALILRAAAQPLSSSPQGRPREVRLHDVDQAKALSSRLADAEIPVRSGPTERAEAVLDDVISPSSEGAFIPYLIDYSEAELHAYFEAARAFYKTRPWKRLEGHRYLGFQIDDEPWRYLNVMGQMEEEPGLSVFDDWLHLCRFLHNAPSFFELLTEEGNLKPIRAAGALEGVTRAPLSFLHLEDGAYLLQLGIEPLPEGYPLPHRYTLEGPATPRLSLPTYGALMTAVREAVEKRRATPVTSIKETFEVKGLTIALRYPSKGEEAIPEAPDAFRLVLHGAEADEGPNAFPPGARLEIDASGAATLEDVARTVRKQQDDFWISAFGNGDYALWSDAAGRGTPSPYVFQLQGLKALWMELYLERYPMEVMPHPDAEVPEDIHVSFQRP